MVSLQVETQPCCDAQELQKEKEELYGAQAGLQQAEADAAAAKQEAERLRPAQARIQELEREVQCLKEHLASALAVCVLSCQALGLHTSCVE